MSVSGVYARKMLLAEWARYGSLKADGSFSAVPPVITQCRKCTTGTIVVPALIDPFMNDDFIPKIVHLYA